MSDPMDDLPRQKLCELIAAYGRSVCDDPRRCEGLLRDYCGAYKREVHVLVSALKERIAADLLGSNIGVPHEVLVARLTKRLQDDLGLGEDAARWAVESWALALGVIARAPEGSSPKGNAAGRQASKEKKREPVMQGKADAEQPRLHVDKTPGWPKLLALAFAVIAGAVVWWVTSLNEKQGRVMIDKGTGREVVIKPNHSLTMDQTAEETEEDTSAEGPGSDVGSVTPGPQPNAGELGGEAATVHPRSASGWLGVLIQEVTKELAESFRMDKPRGALVAKVLPNSPASKAGFKTGDVVIEFDGDPIDLSSDLPPLVGSTTVGEKTPVKIIRKGTTRTLEVTIGELPKPETSRND